jgi:hypothetical protein
VTKDKIKKVRTAIDELQVQLALGRAESRDLFEEQRKKIKAGIASVQSSMKKADVPPQYSEKVNTELQKLKIKLDILKLKYKVKNTSTRQELKGRKRDFTDRLRLVRDKFQGRKGGNKLKRFNSEIGEAWDHLKKAFTS